MKKTMYLKKWGRGGLDDGANVVFPNFEEQWVQNEPLVVDMSEDECSTERS